MTFRTPQSAREHIRSAISIETRTPCVHLRDRVSNMLQKAIEEDVRVFYQITVDEETERAILALPEQFTKLFTKEVEISVCPWALDEAGNNTHLASFVFRVPRPVVYPTGLYRYVSIDVHAATSRLPKLILDEMYRCADIIHQLNELGDKLMSFVADNIRTVDQALLFVSKFYRPHMFRNYSAPKRNAPALLRSAEEANIRELVLRLRLLLEAAKTTSPA